MAGWTGLEPATSGLTGQRSNQAELPPQGGLDLNFKIKCYKLKNLRGFLILTLNLYIKPLLLSEAKTAVDGTGIVPIS